jgi:hypothetical protein
MSSIEGYGSMIRDTARTGAYADALRAGWVAHTSLLMDAPPAKFSSWVNRLLGT